MTRFRDAEDAAEVDLLRARARRLTRIAATLLEHGGPHARDDADAVLLEARDLDARAAAVVDRWAADLLPGETAVHRVARRAS